MVKKGMNRIISFVMVLSVFAVALFTSGDYLASDELVYGDPVTKTVTFNVDSQFMESNTTLPASRDSARYDDYTMSTHYFYRHFSGAEIINGEPDVYAYYVKIENVSVEQSKSFQCLDFGFMLGAAHQTDDLSGLKLEVDNNQVAGSVWLVNDYADINYYLVPYGYFYSTITTQDSGSVTQNKPYLIFKATYDVTVYAYTIEEYTDVLLSQILTELELHGDLTVELKSILEDALYSDGGMSLADQLTSVNSYLGAIQYSYLTPMKDMLNSIEVRAREILEEEQKQTSWLEKIWNSLIELINPSDEDKTEVEKFDSESAEQSSELDSLISDMDSLNKPGADSFNTDLGDIVSDNDISTYSMVLATVTESKLVFSMMVIVFTIGLVGYALFGKRG